MINLFIFRKGNDSSCRLYSLFMLYIFIFLIILWVVYFFYNWRLTTEERVNLCLRPGTSETGNLTTLLTLLSLPLPFSYFPVFTPA